MHPLEYVRGLLGTKVQILLRDRREIRGVLRMFDEHLNLMVSDTADEQKTVQKKEVLFIRSDNFLSIAES